VSGVALGAVPGGGLAAQVATAGGVLDEGTRAARIGRSVGEMVGGIVCLLLGGAGEVGGGAASATGVGALVGAPVMIGSAALVTGGAANIAAGASGLVQALMSSGSGGKNYGKTSYPSADKLAERLGVSRNAFHRDVKMKILKDFSAETNRIGAKNPDIGVDEAGNIVLRNPKTLAEARTGVSLSSYGSE
jgi:hypothetical protein